MANWAVLRQLALPAMLCSGIFAGILLAATLDDGGRPTLPPPADSAEPAAAPTTLAATPAPKAAGPSAAREARAPSDGTTVHRLRGGASRPDDIDRLAATATVLTPPPAGAEDGPELASFAPPRIGPRAVELTAVRSTPTSPDVSDTPAASYGRSEAR